MEIGGLNVYVGRVDGSTPDALRKMGDELKKKGENTIGVIAGATGDKASIVAVCAPDAVANGVKAGDLVREIAKLAGGGGGGRPDSAMAGAKDISKLDDALKKVSDIVSSMLK